MISSFRFSLPAKKRLLVVLTIVFSIAIIILRRPDAITNPQFWAEDGATWYADAYNIGPIKPLFTVANGHFQTIPKLIAAIAQLLPVYSAPFFFNLVAIFLQLLPIVIFLTHRFDRYLPRMSLKLFIILIYLLLPNISEVYINLTNSQWFFALSGAMIIFSEVPQNTIWKYFDVIILFLSGVSGPFSIFWLPIVFLQWLRKPKETSLRNLLIIAFTATIQLFALFSSPRGTFAFLSGSTFELLYSIFFRQIIWGSLIGPNGYLWIIDKMPFHSLFFAATTVLGLAIISYALLKAPESIKYFTLFAGLNFFAGLLKPAIINVSEKSAWQMLFEANGIRYWFLPMIGFLVILFWGARKTVFLPVRLISLFFLTCMVLFTVKTFRRPENFRFPPYIDYHYQDEVKKFLELPKGEKMAIPINPSGWQMELIKKE